MIKINLLPKGARKRVGIGEQLAIIVVVLLASFTGIGFYWGYLNNVIEQRQQTIAKTQQRLDELKKVIDEIETFKKQQAALQQKLDVIAKLQKDQQLPVRLLDEVYLTLEDEVWLRAFSIADKSINIQGMALSNPVVANYQRKLEKSKYFSNINLGGTQLQRIGTQDARSFSFTAVLVIPADTPKEDGKPAEPPPK